MESKLLPYGPIFAISIIELKTLKTYIKIYLKTRFIQLSKSLIRAFIHFDKKPKNSFWLCMDYQDPNNLTIKNRYLLPLIKKFLD